MAVSEEMKETEFLQHSIYEKTIKSEYKIDSLLHWKDNHEVLDNERFNNLDNKINHITDSVHLLQKDLTADINQAVEKLSEKYDESNEKRNKSDLITRWIFGVASGIMISLTVLKDIIAVLH